jgi:hypothetical protein
MGNKQTCAQTRDQLENPKRIKTEQSLSRSLLQHTETKKKKKKRKLHQYSSNPARIHENFQLHRKALVGLLHTLQTKKLCNSTTHDTLSSLSLSPAPYGGKFKPERAGIRNCTPKPIRVSNSTTILTQNKILGLIYTRGESNNQVPGYFTPPWLSKTQIPGYYI